jgi:GT2 family glycosyltransferase
VIDDASTDNTKQVVKKLMKKSKIPIKYFLNKSNNSIPAARNRGIKESSGDWIAFFDDDQIADKNWLKELYLFASERNIHIVGGPRALFLSKEELSRMSPICRITLGETLDKNISRYDGRKARLFSPLASIGTGNLIVKKDIFDIVGNFDESLIYGEDSDFFRKARAAGIEIWYTPKALMHHRIPPYRLTKKSFAQISLMRGIGAAVIDYRELGKLRMMISCAARIARILIINIPFLFLAYLLKDSSEALGQKCMIWRTEGYLNFVLHAIAPKLFSQAKFFNSAGIISKTFNNNPS